jgi:hypothetical protein
MGAAVLLTLAFVTCETTAGHFAHSLALLSDAGHNFADALALAFSWYAIWIGKKGATSGMTFGLSARLSACRARECWLVSGDRRLHCLGGDSAPKISDASKQQLDDTRRCCRNCR